MTAPGVQILAGAADQPTPTTMLRPGFLFQAIQGTSMASPHVAGAGALLTQAHPTLSPAELKSELMLTANPNVLKEDGKTPADVFDRGSGEIDPNKAADSGLVLDTTTDDYLSYLEFVDPTIVDGDIPKTRPNDLNLPSISFSKFAGKDSTTRVFKSIDSTATRWTVSFEGLAGIQRDRVDRAVLHDQAGPDAADHGRRCSSTTAPLNKYAFGALVLTSGTPRRCGCRSRSSRSRSPRPTKVTVSTAAAAGTQPIPVTPGFTGPALGRSAGASRRRPSRPASGSPPRRATRTRAAPTRARSCTR